MSDDLGREVYQLRKLRFMASALGIWSSALRNATVLRNARHTIPSVLLIGPDRISMLRQPETVFRTVAPDGNFSRLTAKRIAKAAKFAAFRAQLPNCWFQLMAEDMPAREAEEKKIKRTERPGSDALRLFAATTASEANHRRP
jgi:hypothetical protein